MSLRVEIKDCVDDDTWNGFVARQPDADLMQTTHWADVVAGYHGHTPRYAWVHDGKQPVGALLLFVEPYFQMLTRATHPLLNGPTKRALPVLRWKRGPVIPDPGRRVDVLDALLSGLQAEARSMGALGVAEATSLPDLVQPDCAAVLSATGTWHTHATFLVDLSTGEDAVWAGMKKVARKAVRRAESQGIVVRRLTDEKDLGKVWRMLTEGWERLGTRYGDDRTFSGFYGRPCIRMDTVNSFSPKSTASPWGAWVYGSTTVMSMNSSLDVPMRRMQPVSMSVTRSSGRSFDGAVRRAIEPTTLPV